MADPPSPNSLDSPNSLQYRPSSRRFVWTGGPRLPIARTSRRSVTRDDLDAIPSTSVPLADRLFDIAMRGFLADWIAAQPGLPGRSSRPRPLRPDEQQEWQRVLERYQPRLPHLDFPSAPASASDSRRSFFGPREQLRRPRAGPPTPRTPRTPYTPYTPDSPELETPDDNIPGSRAQNQKPADTDSEDGSFDAREHTITPFPLWEFPSSVGKDIRTSEEVDPTGCTSNDSYLSYESVLPPVTQHYPEIAPLRPWRVVNALPQDAELSSDSHRASSAPPTPSPPEFPLPASPIRTLRPRLSIITQISRGQSETFSRGVQVAPQPIPPSPSALPKHPDGRLDITAQVMRKLTTDILQDKPKYKALLAHRGDKAQQILDCLQVVLDHPSLCGPDRAIILKALTRLSTASGLYPQGFKLDNVEMLGSVWKASSHNQVVSVKILRTYQHMPTQPLLKNLSHEALLWGQLTHPNILPFYGININGIKRRFGLVSPWMENGNILSYLKKNPNVPRTPLVHDIASGLQYLHSLNIVHGDVKGTNVLVTSAGRACLADFGLSSLLGDNILTWPSLGSGPRPSGGTTRWKAPELFLLESMDYDSPPTQSSDVYSFACTAYEVFTGLLPFHEIKGAEALIAKLVHSPVQPSRPPPEKIGPAAKELTDEVWRFLEDCWNPEPAERLTVAGALERLERMMTPEQTRSLKGRVDDADRGARLSSSSFRTFARPSDKPSDEQLLRVMSMISA